MQKCPRCHSSMLLDFTQTDEGFRRMWKCIGCGREILTGGAQTEDDRLLEQVRKSVGIS